MAGKSKCTFDSANMILISVFILALMSNCVTVQGRHFLRVQRSPLTENLSGTDSKETASTQKVTESTASTETAETSICEVHRPCGWAVYNPSTRVVEYFMKNTCVCPKDKDCVRSDDNISVRAYVYRCRVDT